ncbi:hypothetical protein BD770DRAFT_410951 [Pilaira anomala]|nr:hypothetical protein BD770DRAFT_410951 [Pilaira anomala]
MRAQEALVVVEVHMDRGVCLQSSFSLAEKEATICVVNILICSKNDEKTFVASLIYISLAEMDLSVKRRELFNYRQHISWINAKVSPEKYFSGKTCTIIFLLFSSTRITTTLAQQQQQQQAEEEQCFSLKDSKTCAAFQSFYISISGNQAQYPFLSNVTDIKSFDEGMKNLMKTASPYYQQLGCNNKATDTATTIPYARYSLSYLCASLIQDSIHSLPCNYQHNLNPPPLCQSTCYDYTSSVQHISSNPDVCPNQAESTSQLLNLNSTCVYWSGLNGTLNCILGKANEPENCGFQLLSDGCEYCKSNKEDTCCQSLNGCRKLSVGAIIGIIIGVLGFLSIIGAIVFYLRSKQRTRKGVSYLNTGFSMNAKVEQNHHHHHHNDSSSALGYESLGSQGVLVPPSKQHHQQQLQQEQQHLFNHHQHKSSIDTSTPHVLLPSLQSPPPPPPPPITTTTTTTTTTELPQQLEEFYQVKHPYPPQMGDELGLHVGDIVCVAMNFDDGWALGFNVTTGLKGVFPVVCVSPAPEELLEQLLYDQPTNKTLVEEGSLDHLNMQQICENLRRSMSASSKRTVQNSITNSLPSSELTQHSNIPRRTASMMRHGSYDYRESDSPTSPTLHTPLFDVNLLQQHGNSSSSPLSQPEPALFQPIETYEMYRKSNRVSKLEAED